jgi:hypothetical protein
LKPGVAISLIGAGNNWLVNARVFASVLIFVQKALNYCRMIVVLAQQIGLIVPKLTTHLKRKWQVKRIHFLLNGS